VALYGKAGKRWTMTERSRKSLVRDASSYSLGPSSLRWDGASLVIEFDEVGMPVPLRAKGRVRLHPHALFNTIMPLDDGAHHRWGPIAPCARVEVELSHPQVKWSGEAYFDSNEGDEPINTARQQRFVDWDWSRATMRDGSTAVIYDVRQREGTDRVLAMRFNPKGIASPFEVPNTKHTLPMTMWRIARNMRQDNNAHTSIIETLEDTPFYARSVLRTKLMSEEVTAMHETLHVPRLASMSTQLMLPWRMPRLV
jgi:carotenoid 1,2-hydratase